MKDYKIFIPNALDLPLTINEMDKPYNLPAGVYEVHSDNSSKDAPADVAEIKLPNEKTYQIPFGQPTIYGYEYAAMSVTAECDPVLLNKLTQLPDKDVFELLEKHLPKGIKTVYEFVFGQDSAEAGEYCHRGFKGDFHKALRVALLLTWKFTPICGTGEEKRRTWEFNQILFL